MREQLRRDVRDGFRALRSAPLSSATIVCLVAVVVGGNTTIYGLVHALMDILDQPVYVNGQAAMVSGFGFEVSPDSAK